MGTLAIDIETASPFEEPQEWEDYQDTAYFELVAVALGYRSSSREKYETSVLFRDGGWTSESTAGLLNRVLNWCDGRTIDQTLTYNGTGFDEIHLRNWAADLDDHGLRTDVTTRIDRLFSNHVDLAVPAGERYENRLDYRDFPKFEDACHWEGIETSPTFYSDYALDDVVMASEIDDDQVEGSHIGTTWGEKYVQWVTAELQDTQSFRELQQLLTDYAVADVYPLYDLHESLLSMTKEQ